MEKNKTGCEKRIACRILGRWPEGNTPLLIMDVGEWIILKCSFNR